MVESLPMPRWWQHQYRVCSKDKDCDELVAGDGVKQRIVYLLLKALTGQVDVPVGEMCKVWPFWKVS